MEPHSRVISYYLPEDLIQWIESQSKENRRSASNYLARLIEKARENGGQ